MLCETRQYCSGWWLTYPSEKWWSERQLGWWHSQLIWKKTCSKAATSIPIIFPLLVYSLFPTVSGKPPPKFHGSSHHQLRSAAKPRPPRWPCSPFPPTSPCRSPASHSNPAGLGVLPSPGKAERFTSIGQWEYNGNILVYSDYHYDDII